ncbi:hypothetical protein [Streptomyces niveus]|uniref:hypothetical protein n=1 Tax=Streptomyces niveus TaxID=193462 RepID=UPI00341AB1BA
MTTVESSTPLKSVYAEKLTADLERNTTEQVRVREELESLTAQLHTLENDRELLVGMSAALGEPEKVPAPRRASKGAASTGKATAKRAAAKKTAARPEGKKKVPVTELIHQYLTQQSEPRTASEIAKDLAKDHPDRNLSDNLVRTATERLVAGSRAERDKQGRTVYYTAIQQEVDTAADSAGLRLPIPDIP